MYIADRSGIAGQPDRIGLSIYRRYKDNDNYASEEPIQCIVRGSIVEKVIFANGMVRIPENVCDYNNVYEETSYIQTVVIPDTVTEIGSFAFFDCRRLSSIDLPSSVGSIGGSAFWYCTGLSSIDIPAGVHYIGTQAFIGCESLATVTFHENNGYMPGTNDRFSLSIGSQAFYGCTSLTELVLPESLTELGYEFIKDTRITTIILPKNLTSASEALSGSVIEEVIFADGMSRVPMAVCDAWGEQSYIHTVVIPDTITYIDYKAFAECEVLSDIYFEGSERQWNAIEKDYAEIPEETVIHFLQNPFKKNAFTITNGPIEVQMGKKAVIGVSYYDSDGKLAPAPGTISWISTDGPQMGLVSIRRISDYYEYYTCEISGLRAGETEVTARTADGRSASVRVIVLDTDGKRMSMNTDASGRLSGSQNYTLKTDANGTFDISGAITSKVVINTASNYTAANKITVKGGGELVVDGILNAAEILIKSNGTLTVNGRVNASKVTFEGGGGLSLDSGGMLRGSSNGVLRADSILFKNDSHCGYDGQLIAEQDFVYKSASDATGFRGTLFIGGDLDVNNHFDISGNGATTVIYGSTSDHTYKLGKKSNLGTILAASTDAYSATGIAADHRTKAHKYTNLVQNSSGKWTYNEVTTASLDPVWEESLKNMYIDLLHNRQIAIDVRSAVSSLSSDEIDILNRIATAWVASIHVQGQSGLLEINESVFDLSFKLNGKSYFLRYTVAEYGSYAQLGSVLFGSSENNLNSVGISAAASITNFKAQAASYLAESYVKEYYSFVTGSIPKSSDGTIRQKLIRGGTDYVKKYMEKMLFSTLSVSEPASYQQVAKTVKLGKLMLNGDVGGLWKFAIKEVSSLKTNSVKSVRMLSAGSDMDGQTMQIRGVTAADAPVLTTTAGDGSVTDEFLKAALVEQLGADGNGDPDFTKQETVRTLELGGRYIRSIEGLENFTNLEKLILSDNEITDISPLASLTTLRFLDLSGQEIADISPLAGLTALVVLDISDNSIESVGSLSGLTDLETLDISNNPITSLSGIESLASLGVLRASGLSLDGGDLSAAGGMSSLREAYLDSCGLDTIYGINTESLEILDIRNNEIELLDPILNAALLQKLDASENQIESIPSLSGCLSLTELDLTGNLLLDIDGIGDAANLEVLVLSACELTNTDIEVLSGLSGLKVLDISYNSIIDDISPILVITTLETVNVTRTDVELTGLPEGIVFIKEDDDPAEILQILTLSDDYYGKTGTQAAFHIDALGTGELTYQWQYRTAGSNTWKTPSKASAKTADYAFTLKPSYDNIEVRCIVTDEGGNELISETRKANVFAVTAQPADAAAGTGETVAFSVAAIGKGLAYQWYFMRPSGNWKKATVAGSDTDTLTITGSTANNGTSYRCLVSDIEGNSITSAAAVLTVAEILKITGLSDDWYGPDGTSAGFHVEANGSTTLSYQWQYKLAGETKWRTPGQASAKTADYSFKMKPSYDDIEVRCIVKDASGNEVISDTRKANVFAITAQPADVTASQGQIVDFAVSSIGRGVTYQWYYMRPNSTWKKALVAGAKTAILPITAGIKNDGTSYCCIITDEEGNQFISKAGVLTLDNSLRITGLSEDVYDVSGESAAFHIDAAGSGELSYQWQYKLSGESRWRTPSLASARTADYVFKLRSSYDNIEIRCIVKDASGNSITSDVRKANVFAITGQPKDAELAIGEKTTFAVEAIGKDLTYQWYYMRPEGSWKKVIVSGYNTASLAITANTKNDGTRFQCRITDGLGNILVSATAMLTQL